MLGKSSFRKFDIASLRIVDTPGSADFRRCCQPVLKPVCHQRFDLAFALVGKLLPVWPKQLDAVVMERVVRGRNHYAEVSTKRAGQHRDRRRRQWTELENVHS